MTQGHPFYHCEEEERVTGPRPSRDMSCGPDTLNGDYRGEYSGGYWEFRL